MHHYCSINATHTAGVVGILVQPYCSGCWTIDATHLLS